MTNPEFAWTVESIHQSERARSAAPLLIRNYMLLTGNEAGAAWATEQRLPVPLQAEVADLESVYRPPGDFLVAFEGDRPVGCVGLHDRGNGEADIRRLWATVSGRGLGTELMDMSESLARQRGFETLILDVLPTRTFVVNMYRRRGYVECEPFEELPVPMVFMSKRIAT